MTGHGRGEATADGHKATVELSSVNRRQSEMSIHLPREIEPLEARIRNELNRQVSRGRLTVKVTLHTTGKEVSGRYRLNLALARAYVRELRHVAKDLELDGVVTLEMVARAPGVLQADDSWAEADRYWPLVDAALGKAVAGLVRMREREGAHLERDLRKRVRALRGAVVRIGREAPKVVVRYREALRERIAAAGVELPQVEDERLLREVIYFADRSDIAEELTRLESHFKQFEDCLKAGEPVGRTLDFLAQEMNREVNTIGSKANDSIISREVVQLKAELEKFREQAQNVE
ncbi:MAG: YicC family protein [Verrucomicrobia bacterium]|nr:YicC family protein [Verrucomicrobiota bacterium]